MSLLKFMSGKLVIYTAKLSDSPFFSSYRMVVRDWGMC